MLPSYDIGDYDNKDVKYSLRSELKKYLTYDEKTKTIFIIEDKLKIAGQYEFNIKVELSLLMDDPASNKIGRKIWKVIEIKSVRVMITKPVPICSVIPRMV